MFGEEFDEGGVSLAVVSLGSEIYGIKPFASFDDFFLTCAGFDGDCDFHYY